MINQELWLKLDWSRPHKRIVWLISPKSSKKLKRDDLISIGCDFGNAGSFTEIFGVTVILTDAPASNCGSGLLQSLRRVTYISDTSKKEKMWSQLEEKEKKKYKRRGGRREERGSWCWWREHGQIKNAEFQTSSRRCTGLLALTCWVDFRFWFDASLPKGPFYPK